MSEFFWPPKSAGGGGSGITSLTGDIVATGPGAANAQIQPGVVGNTELASGLDISKFADGSVSNTELQYIGGLTSDAQTQLSSLQSQATSVQSQVNILSWKLAVKVASTASLTLLGEQTIDGITLVSGDRILVKNQSPTSNNGIYIVSTGAWTRATDADTAAKLDSGAICWVQTGLTNSDRAFRQSNILASLSSSQIWAVAFGTGIPAASIANGSVSDAEFQRLDGVTSPIQTQLNNKLDLSGGTLTGALILAADPVSSLGAATKQYVDALVNGIQWKAPARVATTTNITLSGTQTIDGVAAIVGDRVLVKNQSTASDNGIYIVDSGSWTRAADADTFQELLGAVCLVEEGTANADKGFQQTAELISLSSSQVWIQNFGTSLYVADESTLTLSGSTFSVKAGGITNTHVSASAAIAKSKLALTGSIVDADISNSAAIVYSKLSLTGSIVNADISTSAAIAYSKLNLAASIVNADVNASAAIAGTKISPNFGSQNIVTTGTCRSGDLVSGRASSGATAVSQCTIGTFANLHYERNGNTVSCKGFGTVTSGSLGATSRLTINIPIASTLTATGDAVGQCVWGTNTGNDGYSAGYGIWTSGSTIEFFFISTVASTAANFTYSFTYEIK